MEENKVAIKGEIKKEKKKKNKVLLIILIVLFMTVVIGGAMLTGIIGGGDQLIETVKTIDFDMDGAAEDGDITKKTAEEIQAELNAKVALSSIRISMNPNPVFETGDSKGKLLIVNKDTNNYAMVVEVNRLDTGEIIYKSGGIKVGSKLEESKLSVNLPKGNYDCVATFNAVDENTKAFIGKAKANIVVSVLN